MHVGTWKRSLTQSEGPSSHAKCKGIFRSSFFTFGSAFESNSSLTHSELSLDDAKSIHRLELDPFLTFVIVCTFLADCNYISLL